MRHWIHHIVRFEIPTCLSCRAWLVYSPRRWLNSVQIQYQSVNRSVAASELTDGEDCPAAGSLSRLRDNPTSSASGLTIARMLEEPTVRTSLDNSSRGT